MDKATAGASTRFARILMIGLAIALQWFSVEARAGCGTIVTLNPTDHWMWITIYDVGQNIQMDYGYVAPHSGRKWTGGASPLPYACGSFYYVRAEVKASTDPKTNPGNPPNIFDTRMRINPQLTLSDIVQVFQGIGTLISCVAPGVGTASCVARFGIEEGAQQSLLGAIGSDSRNSVVCLKTNNNVNFWLENSDSCAQKPPMGKAPPPPADVYKMAPATTRVGLGLASHHVKIIKNDRLLDPTIVKKGRFYSDNPGIANFKDPHDERYHVFKAGKTHVHWDFEGKRRASAEVEVIKTN